jgi:hypothetical protein
MMRGMTPPLSLEQYAEVLGRVHELDGAARHKALLGFGLSEAVWQAEADRWAAQLLDDMDSEREERLMSFALAFEASLRAQDASRHDGLRAPSTSDGPCTMPSANITRPQTAPPPSDAEAPAMPFVPAPPPIDLSARPSLLGENGARMSAQSGATRGVDPRWIGRAATPFDKDSLVRVIISQSPAARSGATAGVSTNWQGKALPFVTGGVVEPPHAVDAKVAAPGSGATAGVDPRWLKQRSTPFDKHDDGRATPSRASSLTIEQYASLCVELAELPHEAAQIRAKYQLQTDEDLAATHETWGRHFSVDAASHGRWQELMQRYRDWWRATRQA